MKNLKYVFFAFALFIFIGVSAFAIRWYSAPIEGQLEAREQIFRGESQIQNYEWFYQTCAEITTLDRNVQIQKERLATLTNPETNREVREYNRLAATISGIQSQQNRLISQYNARSREIKTRGQFRDPTLPQSLTLQTITACP